MTLQLRNLRLLNDHDVLMRGIEKKQVGGQKRDNKIQNIHQINRLEREIERTAKQLRVEASNIEMKDGQHTEQENNFLVECDGLISQAEEYFENKEKLRVDRMVRRDYKKVNSRINTNLAIGKEPKQRMQALPEQIEEP